MTKYTFDTDLFSDFHKEVYGFRPRQHVFYVSNDENKQIIWNNLMKEMDHVHKMHEKREKENAEIFEIQIHELIELGANDRETAIRWIIESYDEYDSFDYICWDLGLPGIYQKEFECAIYNEKRLKEVC